ncbi:hypothetical protein V1514DRAFT_347424 [Lipomyces japonicus]|uniref:uncharacterized protein n=1 Tax=Lipomyces japonicus TaxID=56871 RepID=UPI0034CF9208
MFGTARSSHTTALGIDFTHAFASVNLSDTETTSDVVSDADSECCGGGCCMTGTSTPASVDGTPPPFLLTPPQTKAFKSLRLPIDRIARIFRLVATAKLPDVNVFFEFNSNGSKHVTDEYLPPAFVTPHPPYSVQKIPVIDARLLTSADAHKRTYHFDLDVSDYPEEIKDVDFRVGGAVGVCPANDTSLVNEVITRLGIQSPDTLVKMHTKGGRWPTIWGEEEARSLKTSLREILTWTVDLNNGIITKNLFRVLAEYAEDQSERSILLWLCSRQGQSTFCSMRSAAYPPTLIQLLHAFPSTKPSIESLISVLPTLMPRFYSLSSDPIPIDGHSRRKIEVAVTVHESPEEWREAYDYRAGNCSGYFETIAKRYIQGISVSVPLFRGLQANPLAREFRPDGPMLLVGAGVGIAPFRGYVQRRLKSATCKNKVWVLQGCRDSLVDELYAGEWGIDDSDVRRVIESRRGTKKYVQDEVLAQSDLVWSVISHPDGKVFVCGSSKGMGEGVERALITVAVEFGGFSQEEAVEYWEEKKRTWQYVTETW